MRYLPGEAPGRQGMIPTKRRCARTATSHADADEATDEVDDNEAHAAALNTSLADSVRAGVASEDDEDEQGEEDDEEVDPSDMKSRVRWRTPKTGLMKTVTWGLKTGNLMRRKCLTITTRRSNGGLCTPCPVLTIKSHFIRLSTRLTP